MKIKLIYIICTIFLIGSLVGCSTKKSTTEDVADEEKTIEEVEENSPTEEVENTEVVEEKEPDQVFEEPLEEMKDLSFKEIKIQIANKIFKSPFKVSDLCALGYQVYYKPESQFGNYSVNISGGSTYMIGEEKEVQTMLSVDSGTLIFVDEETDIEQTIEVYLYSFTGEQVPIHESYVGLIGGDHEYSTNNYLFDIIFPGGISYYKTYTNEELKNVFGDERLYGESEYGKKTYGIIDTGEENKDLIVYHFMDPEEENSTELGKGDGYMVYYMSWSEYLKKTMGENSN